MRMALMIPLMVVGIAHAGEQPSAPSPKATAAVDAGKALAGTEVTANAGLKAAKGPDGKLRAPNAQETEVLAERKAALITDVRVNEDGSITAELGEGFMSDLVAVKNADGSLSLECSEHAGAHPKHVPAATATLETE